MERCEVKYSLLVKIFYFDISGAMCRGGTLQSAKCHPYTLVAEYRTGTSFSLRNLMPVVREVSPQDFLPVMGAPWPKITNRVFLTVVRSNGAFDRRATKTWVRPSEMLLWVKFSKF